MTFLEELYKIERKEQAIDLVFAYMDDLLVVGKFDEVDNVLKQTDFERLSDSAVILTLVVTSDWARERLPSRLAFIDRAEKRLISLVGKEKTDRLLANLKGTDPSETGKARQLLGRFIGYIPEK